METKNVSVRMELTLLTVILACIPVVLGDCTADLINCTQSMSDMDVILLGIKEMDKHDLWDHCELFDAANKCVLERLVNCREGVWDAVGRFRETFNYICQNSNRYAYLEHSKCFAHVTEEDSCRDEFKSSVTKLTKTYKKEGWVQFFVQTVNLSPRSMELICNSSKKYLTCIEETANATCGWDAAAFQYELLRRGLVQQLSDIDCDLGYPRTDELVERVVVPPGLSVGTVGGIGLGIAVVIIVLALVGRYLCLRYAPGFDTENDELLDDDDTRSTTSGGSVSGSGEPSTSGSSRVGGKSKRGGETARDDIALASAVV